MDYDFITDNLVDEEYSMLANRSVPSALGAIYFDLYGNKVDFGLSRDLERLNFENRGTSEVDQLLRNRVSLNYGPETLIKNINREDVNKLENIANEFDKVNGYVRNGSKRFNYIKNLIKARQLIDTINPLTEEADELLGENTEPGKTFKTSNSYINHLYDTILPLGMLEDIYGKEEAKKKRRNLKRRGYQYDKDKALKELAKAGPSELLKLRERINDTDLFDDETGIEMRNILSSLYNLKKAPVVENIKEKYDKMLEQQVEENDEDEEDNEEDRFPVADDEGVFEEVNRRNRIFDEDED